MWAGLDAPPLPLPSSSLRCVCRLLPPARCYHRASLGLPPPPSFACRLGEVIDEAEARDGELEELHKKRREVRGPVVGVKGGWAGCAGVGCRPEQLLGRGSSPAMYSWWGGRPPFCGPWDAVPASLSSLPRHPPAVLCPALPVQYASSSAPCLPLLPPFPPAQVRAAHGDLRDLCALMSGQMARLRSLLEFAGKGAEALGDKVGGGRGSWFDEVKLAGAGPGCRTAWVGAGERLERDPSCRCR